MADARGLENRAFDLLKSCSISGVMSFEVAELNPALLMSILLLSTVAETGDENKAFDLLSCDSISGVMSLDVDDGARGLL
jgi:hypothetical protein